MTCLYDRVDAVLKRYGTDLRQTHTETAIRERVRSPTGWSELVEAAGSPEALRTVLSVAALMIHEERHWADFTAWMDADVERLRRVADATSKVPVILR